MASQLYEYISSRYYNTPTETIDFREKDVDTYRT